MTSELISNPDNNSSEPTATSGLEEPSVPVADSAAAPATSNSAAAASPQTATTSGQPTQSSQSAFVQHLATYPALTALAGLIASSPVAKIFMSNAVPLLQAMHERSAPVVDPVVQSATPAFRRCDELGDRFLTNLDSRFPQLKTPPAQLYTNAQTQLHNVKTQTEAQVKHCVVEPFHNATNSVKEVYEVQGNQISRALNSNIAPLNSKIATAIQEYLPEGAPLPSDEVPEAERTILLVRAAADRARPQIAAANESTRAYILTVYRAKLEEKGGAKPGVIARCRAAAATSRVLAGDTVTRAKGWIRPSRANNAAPTAANAA